jgi:hypothetical protein
VAAEPGDWNRPVHTRVCVQSVQCVARFIWTLCRYVWRVFCCFFVLVTRVICTRSRLLLKRPKRPMRPSIHMDPLLVRVAPYV